MLQCCNAEILFDLRFDQPIGEAGIEDLRFLKYSHILAFMHSRIHAFTNCSIKIKEEKNLIQYNL